MTRVEPACRSPHAFVWGAGAHGQFANCPRQKHGYDHSEDHFLLSSSLMFHSGIHLSSFLRVAFYSPLITSPLRPDWGYETNNVFESEDHLIRYPYESSHCQCCRV